MYNRSAAINYALTYALTPNSKYRFFSVQENASGDCTNFISQCLHAGGCPMDFTSSFPWWYNMKKLSWSFSWSVANSLYNSLLNRGRLKIPGVKGIMAPNFTKLELGDVIFYENYRGKIYHSAIVTSWNERNGIRFPLISQHTINAENITFIKPKAYRTHFMKIYI